MDGSNLGQRADVLLGWEALMCAKPQEQTRERGQVTRDDDQPWCKIQWAPAEPSLSCR